MKKTSAVALLLMIFAAVSLWADDAVPFRVEVERYGRAGFDIVLKSGEGGAYMLKKPATLNVALRGGMMRPIAFGGGPWKPTLTQTIKPDQALPPFEFQPANHFWPDELTIYASVRPEGETEIRSIPLTVIPKPPLLIGLFLAIAGAMVFTIIQIFHSTARRVRPVGAALALGLAVALVAFFGVEFRPIWQVVGFDQTPLRVQSYFVLSFMLALVGVPKFFDQVTGEKKEALVTPQGLREEVMKLLTGDVVRKPMREELQAMFYNAQYLRDNPEVMPRLEVALTEAKKAGTIPPGLAEHLIPRLEQLYARSYRKGLHTKIDATIEANAISWMQTDYYEFVRHVADTGEEPEVRVSYGETVLKSMQTRPVGDIESLGTVMKSIELRIRHEEVGVLVYAGDTGKKLVLVEAPPGVQADKEISIAFTFDRDTKEVRAMFEYRLPAAFRAKSNGVFIEMRAEWLRDVEDGVVYVRVARPTFGYDLSVQFTPKVQLEIVEFEWKRVGDVSSDIDEESGTAHLHGWLLPGNGICVAWHGTAGARESLTAQPARTFLRRLVNMVMRRRG